MHAELAAANPIMIGVAMSQPASQEQRRTIALVGIILAVTILATVLGMRTDLHKLVAMPLHRLEMDFTASVLALDWTDEQIAAAQAGLPLPEPIPAADPSAAPAPDSISAPEPALAPMPESASAPAQ